MLILNRKFLVTPTMETSLSISFRNERRQPLRETGFVTKFTLPNDFDTKAQLTHGGLLACVAGLISLDFFTPPLVVGTREARERTRFVTVPEAPVYEDAPTPRLVGYVRTARKILRTDAKARAEVVEKSANGSLGFGIALLDRLHSFGRLGSRIQSLEF